MDTKGEHRIKIFTMHSTLYYILRYIVLVLRVQVSDMSEWSNERNQARTKRCAYSVGR
jgi:hypothetical protein